MRHLPRRRHRLEAARDREARQRRARDRGPRQPQRDLPQPQADRVARGSLRRQRAADRQVPADLPRMTTAPASGRTRLLTIGAVCRRLKPEFPDVSISKIRYLEGEGLVTPRRTQGGYRLFSEEDLERLETILRLQRDEFLPLRVIREELATGAAKARRKRATAALGEGESDDLGVDELCDRAGVDAARARELEQFGLLESPYGELDVEIAAVCERLARYGIAPRHLRAFRTAADRQAGLLEALVLPSLRSRNPERRRAGLDDLGALTEAAQELSQLLLSRTVRKLAG